MIVSTQEAWSAWPACVTKPRVTAISTFKAAPMTRRIVSASLYSDKVAVMRKHVGKMHGEGGCLKHASVLTDPMDNTAGRRIEPSLVPLEAPPRATLQIARAASSTSSTRWSRLS